MTGGGGSHMEPGQTKFTNFGDLTLLWVYYFPPLGGQRKQVLTVFLSKQYQGSLRRFWSLLGP